MATTTAAVCLAVKREETIMDMLSATGSSGGLSTTERECHVISSVLSECVCVCPSERPVGVCVCVCVCVCAPLSPQTTHGLC